jgi:hypothetical protein
MKTFSILAYCGVAEVVAGFGGSLLNQKSHSTMALSKVLRTP